MRSTPREQMFLITASPIFTLSFALTRFISRMTSKIRSFGTVPEVFTDIIEKVGNGIIEIGLE